VSVRCRRALSDGGFLASYLASATGSSGSRSDGQYQQRRSAMTGSAVNRRQRLHASLGRMLPSK